ncbi:hypothetical protein [Mucilaginibacter psychrotolerans]|uniref:Uncharacterized protein n=1 Tax=Mucilaginibacter psychrotolerans TaxID=1524096 RepID=A0A4Y8SGK3_9SPHI|nr:hypothetical protein [Mucilaginibacter psychrotolerans]TFF37801.1 hypothetical protein E2R66_11590 [Mucilaginibacter psychrotolerans]
METYYKIFRVDSDDLKHQTGEYPLGRIIPFGPPFGLKSEAKHWLKENLVPGTDYCITRFYSQSMPEGIQKSKKKNLKK